MHPVHQASWHGRSTDHFPVSQVPTVLWTLHHLLQPTLIHVHQQACSVLFFYKQDTHAQHHHSVLLHELYPSLYCRRRWQPHSCRWPSCHLCDCNLQGMPVHSVLHRPQAWVHRVCKHQQQELRCHILSSKHLRQVLLCYIKLSRLIFQVKQHPLQWHCHQFGS